MNSVYPELTVEGSDNSVSNANSVSASIEWSTPAVKSVFHQHATVTVIFKAVTFHVLHAIAIISGTVDSISKLLLMWSHILCRSYGGK